VTQDHVNLISLMLLALVVVRVVTALSAIQRDVRRIAEKLDEDRSVDGGTVPERQLS
jgi:hypothetical protein